MTAAASRVGVPQTAAVGWTAPISSSRPALPRQPRARWVPVTSLARWRTFASVSSSGSAGASRVVQYGSSARTSESTASACSARSFAEPISASARRWSSVPAPRGAVPGGTAGRQLPAGAPQQQLGGRPEQPVDGEGPAVGEAVGQPPQQPARVERHVGGDPAGRGPGRPSPGSPAPIRSTAVATAGAPARPGPGRRRRSAAGAGVVVDRGRGSVARIDVADGGDPADAVPPAHGRPRGRRRPTSRPPGRTRCSRTRPARTRGSQVLVDGEVGGVGRPPVGGLGQGVRSADLQPRGLAPADQALAAAHPGERALGGEVVQQGAGVVGADGRDRACGGCRRGQGCRGHGPA